MANRGSLCSTPVWIGLCKLFVCSNLVASVTDIEVGALVLTALFTDCLVGPLVLIQVVDEVPLVILTSNNTSLGCC